MTGLVLGLDLGTSGLRSAVLDPSGVVIATARADYPSAEPSADVWWAGAQTCLSNQMAALQAAGHDPADITRIGVDGTSGSMVLTDADLVPVSPALMYDSHGFVAEAAAIAALAPDPHISRGSNSATARALRLMSIATEPAAHLLHQADFIAAKLMGRGGLSDYNNALKTGFDPDIGGWPAWFRDLGLMDVVPDVIAPGAHAGPIADTVADAFGLGPTTAIHAGTTDSTAAFLAAAPMDIGAAVTSLGTTLAIKILSPVRIDAPQIGLYSHKLGEGWLVGGASNTGGGVLRSLFSDAELASLSDQIDPSVESPLDYYPLRRPGERFPVNDPNLAPRLIPRPEDDVAFLHGVLESIARIEARCYAEIAARGGPQPQPLLTAGGGAQNHVWTAIRSRVLGCEITVAQTTEAAVGVARLVQAAD